jgi:hypothetical protein
VRRPVSGAAASAEASFFFGRLLFVPLFAGGLAIAAGVDALTEFGTLDRRQRRRAIVGIALGAINIGLYMAPIFSGCLARKG